jgi:oligopeptide transport system substrate-binding protein
MMKTRILTALATLLALPAFAEPGVLDRGIGSEWSSLDPQVNFDGAAGWIQCDAYEGLTTFGPSGDIRPGAAESWTTSDDGLTWTFTLREGLKWSNGDPLTAQDYVNGILRTLDPATGTDKGYYFYSVIEIVGAEAMAYGETTDPATVGISAPDDRTMVVQLLSPAPHVLTIMGCFAGSPLHSPSFEAHGPGTFVDPATVVSNGAYTIAEVVPQSHVLLVRNPNYWDAANVAIEQVKYHVTEDVATELRRYQAGEIDITYDIPLNQIETLKAEIPDEVRIAPSTEVVYYSFNLTNEELQNIDLRRALTLAIDRETLENRIVKGEAIPSYSYAGGFDPTYATPLIAEAAMSQEEREALAQELYAAAGFGPGNPLQVNIVTTVAEDSTRRAQGIALMWQQVLGVEANIESMERKAWLDSFYAGTWDVFADNLIGEFGGAETFLAYMKPSAEAGYNWTGAAADAFEAKMDEAAMVPDYDARNALLAEAERILLDDYIFSPVSILPSRSLVNPAIAGWEDSIAGYHHSQWMAFQ